MVMDIDVEELLEAPFRKTEPNISVSPQPSTARASVTRTVAGTARAAGIGTGATRSGKGAIAPVLGRGKGTNAISGAAAIGLGQGQDPLHRGQAVIGIGRGLVLPDHRGPGTKDPDRGTEGGPDLCRDGVQGETGQLVPRGHRASSPILSDWERDKRTVFVAQLAARCTTADLEEFFTAAGKVREARLITDRHSRRHKGVGYVEFYEEETVKKALEMKGQILLGIPIDVQLTESEKNRLAAEAAEGLRLKSEMSYNRLYVGSLHFNITEEDLKAVFEPFGPIEFVDLHKDPETGRSRGFAFIQYERPEDAKIALDKMNGFEIMGRSIRVGHITDKALPGGLSAFNLDESDAAGFTLNSFSRAELMAKLARDDMPGLGRKPAAPVIMPTRCILLKNMFGPEDMTEENWDKELEEDVQSECSKYGKVVHIAVEKDTEGHIYMKYNSIPEASAALQGLNGRFFGGKQIEAAYVVEAIYNARHPTATYV
ncbi:hypothetical protein HK104_000443 [Borealophlyctis nickersoniae]|nr:hypothetical protein HK104_000443 [Borealophlyctis nickersoniae]